MKICFTRANVRDVIHLAHDNKTSGHFRYTKTLARLEIYHWRFKGSDLFDYCQRCRICQQSKDGRAKPFGVHQPLELRIRLWGPLAIDLITHLTETDLGYYCITKVVDSFSKRARIFSQEVHTLQLLLLTAFLRYVFVCTGCPTHYYPTETPSSRLVFGIGWWNVMAFSWRCPRVDILTRMVTQRLWTG